MYNDDLEEDNSDYVEGEGDDGEGEDEEDDVDSDELDDSGVAAASAAANNQAPADQPAEGIISFVMLLCIFIQTISKFIYLVFFFYF